MPRQADPALPERRRAQILDAARYCFRERGFRETTVEEICAEARISPGALYRYFTAKADLVAAVALEARAQAETALEALQDEALIDGFARMAEAYFATFADPKDAALLADVYAEAARDPDLARALRVREQRAAGQVAAAIDRACASGEARPAMGSAEAAELLLAALEGMALRGRIGAEAIRHFRSLALHLLKPKR